MTTRKPAEFDYASQQRSPRKHVIGISVVVLMHLVLLWAINNGLARKFVKIVRGPVEAVLLSEDKPELPPPPPPAPRKEKAPPPPPPAYVPPVEVPVNAPPPANAIAAVSNVPPPAAPVPAAPPAPPAPPKAVVRTAAVINSANCEKPEYPSASRRAEEEGTVSLRFLVGVDGRVKESEVASSSGYKRLDEAARAGLSKCQFKPATVDGQPEETWAAMKYTWRLE